MCIGSSSKDIFFPTDEGVILSTPEDVTSQVKVAFELGGKFRTKDRYEAVGGVAANVAQGLAQLGLDVYCYSKVGADETGNWIRRTLEQQGVVIDSLFVDRSVKSDLSAIVVITQSGDRIIFHNRDANERLEILSDRIPPADWYFVSALNGSWEEHLRSILALAKDRNVRIALNPGQHNLKANPRFMLESLPDVYALFLNKDEAIELLLSGGKLTDRTLLEDEAALIRALHVAGVTLIGLTDGKRGAWASDGKEMLHADIYEPHGLVDTTGAGDAFSSGFLAAHLQHLSLTLCLQFGIANAGSVVGSYGAAAGLLDREHMTNYLSRIAVYPLLEVKE